MNANHKILIIDDDIELTQLLSDYLSYEGFELTACHDGLSGLDCARAEQFSLILLDVMMPKLNGFEVLKALGGRHRTPILMLTAKGDNEDKILGLELGADDYLAKPFQHKELLARINAILRRIDITQQSQPQEITSKVVNNIHFNHASRQAFCLEHEIELTGTEYQVLELLFNHVGQIISKEQISELILKRKLSAFDRSIDMHVSNIRKKIQSFCQQEKIKTIRGAGYIFLSGS